MAVNQDRIVGSVIVGLGLAGIFYYAAWTLVMPFVDEGHPLHSLFPSRELAILLPLLGVLGVGAVFSIFFARVLISESRKNK